MRAFWVLIIMVSVIVGWFGSEGTIAGTGPSINDVSWPNCTLDLARADAGIVGVTGGLALRPNPCLGKEAALYKHLSVYVNTGYPGPDIARQFQTSPNTCRSGDKRCMAYDYGFNNGTYAINHSLANGVAAKMWWLDVETENSWDDDTAVNRAALQGMVDSIGRFVGKNNIGFYSYPGQWDLITGKWRNGFPAWTASGSTKLADAIMACRQSFTGGPVLLGQYTPNLDVDYPCQ